MVFSNVILYATGLADRRKAMKRANLRDLAETLADLLGTESSDAIEAEAKDSAVFLPNSDVESVVLRGDSAAVPGITDGHCRTYQRAMISWVDLKIKEEGRATE